jgi:hypothetical protein
LEESVSSNVGTIFKRNWVQIPRRKFCLEVEIYCCEGGRIVQVCIVHTIEKWARFLRQVGHEKSRQLEGIRC